MTGKKTDSSVVRKAEQQPPVLSVIIIARDELKYTIGTIESFVKTTKVPSELIVIDNCTTDGTKEWLASQKYITTIRVDGEVPIPYGTALNKGLKIAKGEYLAVCNNDLIFTTGWEDYMLMLVDNNKPKLSGIDKIGIIAPMTNSGIVPKRQRIDERIMREKGYSSEHAEEFGRFWANAIMTDPKQNKFEKASSLSAFCWIMTRKCYEEVGEFEVYEPYGLEDEDYLKRAIEKGFTAMICKFSFVHHLGDENTETVDQGFPILGVAKKPEFYKRHAIMNSEPTDVIKLKTPDKKNVIAEFPIYKKKLVAGYRVKNVERWFKRVLGKMSEVADQIVVFDDHSTDKTVEIAKSFGKVKIVHESIYPEVDFNEARDRDKLWHLCQSLNPDWIIINDGDELLEEKFNRAEAEKLMNPLNPKTYAYFFRYITHWDSEDYQHNGEIHGNQANARMMRNLPNTHIVSQHPQGLHCNSIPRIPKDSIKTTKLRIRHFGNMDPEERLRKYEWYTKIDTQKNKQDIGAEDYSHLLNRRVPLVKFNPNITMDLMTIMKNEMRDPCHLVQFLDEYHLLFDKMIIVDTGSTDESIEVAKYYGAEVYKYSWLNDFAAARNHGLKRSKADWIFWADMDERLGHNVWKWRKLIEEPVLAYMVPIMNFLPFNQRFVSKNYRIFRNVPGIEFVEKVHENIIPSLEKTKGYGLMESIRWDDQILFPGFIHFGYLRPQKELQYKIKMYVKQCSEIIEREPDNHYAHFSLGLDEASNGNDPRAIYHMEQCLKAKPNFTQAKAKLSTIYLRKSMAMCKSALSENGTSRSHKIQLDKTAQAIAPFAQQESNLGLPSRYSEDG